MRVAPYMIERATLTVFFVLPGDLPAKVCARLNLSLGTIWAHTQGCHRQLFPIEYEESFYAAALGETEG